jgi:hypothetical protein
MQVKTFICSEGEWNIYVHTSPSQLPGKGPFWTYCYLKNNRGEIIRLVSRYSPDEINASDIHYQMAILAKSLFKAVKN